VHGVLDAVITGAPFGMPGYDADIHSQADLLCVSVKTPSAVSVPSLPGPKKMLREQQGTVRAVRTV
ncbi:MAG: hypothetical protein KGZ25_11170, partial [Planctomycetes bacterium]|nr:hypothetical protein [Planctomycetota bacterium]